jgi:hypothetical protein
VSKTAFAGRAGQGRAGPGRAGCQKLPLWESRWQGLSKKYRLWESSGFPQTAKLTMDIVALLNINETIVGM